MSSCIEYFRTGELPLVSVLLHEGFRVKELDRSKRSVEFIFEDSTELQDVIRKYWRNELLCPALSLLSSFKQAKHLLYDGIL